MLQSLKFYNVKCFINDMKYHASNIIAGDIDRQTVESRLLKSDKVSSVEVSEVPRDEVKFPVVLLGINEKYYSWEDLAKDFAIGKITGITE